MFTRQEPFSIFFHFYTGFMDTIVWIVKSKVQEFVRLRKAAPDHSGRVAVLALSKA